jgi:hypothetical protein
MINSIINGLLVGILAGFCILYVFQLSKPYPLWMLKIFEHPWILLIMFIIGVLLLNSNIEAGVLLLILTTALVFDKLLLLRKYPDSTKVKPIPQLNIVKNIPIPVTTESVNIQKGIELLPTTVKQPTDFPEAAGYYSSIPEVYANKKGLKDYKDNLQLNTKKYEPYFGSTEGDTINNFAPFF